jgi:uncharacterized protein with PIN domain
MENRKHERTNNAGEIDAIVGMLLKENKRATVAALLAGNDTQCFTTQQYIEMYARLNWKGQEEMGRRCLSGLWSDDVEETLAHKHLRTFREVREVKLDVWAAIPGDLGEHPCSTSP